MSDAPSACRARHGGGEVFTVRSPDGGLRAVFGLAWKKMQGLDALLLGDLFVAEGADQLARSIVAPLPAMARCVGADLISFAGTPHVLKEMVGGFRRRRTRLCSVWIPPELTTPVPDFDRWYLAGSDSDYIT